MNKSFIYTLLSVCLIIKVQAQSSSELFNLGMKAFENRDYVEAYNHFERIFKNQGETDEIHSTAKYYSGESLFFLGEKQAASERYEFLVNNYTWSNFRDASLYKLGIIYFDSKKFSRSRDRFSKLINEYPNSPFFGSAFYWIGESFVEENQIDDAIKFLEDAAAKGRNNRYIDYSIYSLANVYERKEDYKKAVELYDRLLSYYKESQFASLSQYRIGYCYYKLQQYQSAILELNNPIVQTLESEVRSEAAFLLSNCYYRASEFQNAEASFVKFLEQFPNSRLVRNAKYGLGWSYFQQQKYIDAFDSFNQLSALDDSISIRSYYWKAAARLYAGYQNEALKLFNEFVNQYPNSELVNDARYQISGILFSEAKYSDAERYLLKSIGSDNPLIISKSNLLLGEMSLRKQKFSEAAEYFSQCLSISDSHSDNYASALLGLGIALYELQEYNEASRKLIDLESISSNYDHDKLNFYLAETYFAKGNYSEALKRYLKISRNNAELLPLAQYGKGYSYFNLKDYDNAILSISDFIKNNPYDKRKTDARLRLADSYYGNKEFVSASRIYKDIFLYDDKNAQDPYVHYQYAQALYKGGNIANAISEFRKLQSMFPNSKYADKSLFLVGWIFFQKNSYHDAISSYNILADIYPNSDLIPIVYYSIGDAFFNQGKYDSAIVNYQKVMNLYPNSSYVFDAINGIQYCYLAQNQESKAIELIENFVTKNPGLSFSDQLLFKKGEIYYSAGEYEKAKNSYKDFTSRYPNSELIADGYYWIGKSAQNLKENEEAVFNFSKVYESYSKSELAGRALIEIGNIYNQQKKYDQALAIYAKGIEKLSNSSQMAEILYMYASTYAAIGDIGNAYKIFDDIIQYHPETVFADRSKLEIGLIEYTAKRYDTAEIYLKNLAESKTDELGAKAQFYFGMTLFEQGKVNEAISAFVRARTIFPYFDEWITRSTIMLGDCYVKLNDTYKAQQFYRDVIAKHRGDEFGKTAQKKLREIE